MKFHISGKIGVPVGIVILIVGGIVFASAFGHFEESEDPSNWMSEPSSEIIKEFIDEDEDGSAGWYIMIQGDYLADENNDNVTDACEGLNLTITDSSGNDVMESAGTVYCEMDEKYHMIHALDKEHVNQERHSQSDDDESYEEWIIVGIFCDTDDDAGMNGYYETSRNEDGEESEKLVQTDEYDRCRIGEEYTISSQNSSTEMVLFDRGAQAVKEGEGIFALCCGICWIICSLAIIVTTVISGFAMNPGNSAFTTMELGGASPAPVSGEGTTVPGGTPSAVFGAGPTVQPMAVPLAEESKVEPAESSADDLKKKFLAAASKITESEEPEKE